MCDDLIIRVSKINGHCLCTSTIKDLVDKALKVLEPEEGDIIFINREISDYIVELLPKESVIPKKPEYQEVFEWPQDIPIETGIWMRYKNE